MSWLNDIKKFKIQLEKPWVWEGLTPPKDTLGELSDFERRLRRLCFECNHRVLIEIGDEKFDVFLDPDIILILEDLPQKISELSLGKKIQIEFPESYREIAFMPAGGEIYCTLSQFGQMVQREHFLLERTQVLEVLGCFLDEVVCQLWMEVTSPQSRDISSLRRYRLTCICAGWSIRRLIDPSALHNK